MTRTALFVAAAAAVSLVLLVLRGAGAGRPAEARAPRAPAAPPSAVAERRPPLPALGTDQPRGRRLASVAAAAPAPPPTRGALGVRLRGPDGRPVRGALVTLSTAREEQRSRRWVPRSWDDVLLRDRTTRTGLAGFFGLPPGAYDLVAEHADGIPARGRFVVTAGETRRVELVLRTPAEVRGRVLAPPGASFERTFLAWTPRQGDAPPGARRADEVEVPVAPDGSFSTREVRPGRHAVTLVARGTTVSFPDGSWSWTDDVRVPLDGDVVAAGGVELSLDARARFPSTLEVELRVDEGSARDFRVELHDAASGAWVGHDVVDARGRALLERVPPGRHLVVVVSPRGDALQLVPEPVVVEAGRAAHVELRWRAVRGSWTARDTATGAPLADAWIQVAAEPVAALRPPAVPAARVRTDAAGRIAIALAPGTYRVRRGGSWLLAATAPHARVAWTPDGPAAGAVRVP